MRSSEDKLAAFLRGTTEIAVELPDVPERSIVLAACARIGARVVPLTARPQVVVTADGALRDGVVVDLKDAVDAAVPDARYVIVVRCVGNAPLAATMDAYFETTMIPGRDLWLEQLLDEEPGGRVEVVAEDRRRQIEDVVGRRQSE
jgi:acyl-coenzyme A synthetase/AMP-(fatty) acid ligase